MYDFLLILTAATLGLLAHLTPNRHGLILVLRAGIFFTGLLEFSCLAISSLLGDYIHCTFDTLTAGVLTILFPVTCLILFTPIRQLVCDIFTSLDLLITGQVLLPLIRKKVKATEYFASKKIFLPNSFPHLMSLFIYISAVAYLLINIHPATFDIADRSRSLSFLIGQFLSFNGIGLILLSFLGIGIWVSRSGKEALRRLGLTKPSPLQIGIGIFLIFASFYFDALWAIYTHRLAGQDLATELSYYNSATFTIAGSFVPSVILAMLITLCAGIGEEVLFRGALQPVFGILPAALLQGILHAEIGHNPIFIIKVTIWSIFMGLVRRYTNTTTTIIAHVGLNLITIFLFASNP